MDSSSDDESDDEVLLGQLPSYLEIASDDDADDDWEPGEGSGEEGEDEGASSGEEMSDEEHSRRTCEIWERESESDGTGPYRGDARAACTLVHSEPSPLPCRAVETSSGASEV